MQSNQIRRSFVIPILDFSPHSPYNIWTLLADLENIEGEVICIFNSREVYEALHTHQRIDKYCYNKLNAGVSRSWNMGTNLAEGRAVFILNADMHILPESIDALESYLFTLDRAVIVGPQGSHVDFLSMHDLKYFSKGSFHEPVACDAVSGFFFAIHLERFLQHKLTFDVRFSPCFFEEWDMGLQLKQAGLACYVVPVEDFEHHWGVSVAVGDVSIHYFGREMMRDQILLQNRGQFIKKWHPIILSTGLLNVKLETDVNGARQLEPERTTFNSESITTDGIQRLLDFMTKIQRAAYPELPSIGHTQITQQMIKDCVDRYSLPRDAKILDVGCGQGPALDFFRDMGYQAIGITLNDEDLQVCRAKGHEVQKMDQSFLTYSDGHFDFIWVRHCIEHSIFPYFTLTEFFRILNSEGYLYLEVPAPNTAAHHETNANHYSVLTKEMWQSLIVRAGFTLLAGYTFNFELLAGPDEYWAFIGKKSYC